MKAWKIIAVLSAAAGTVGVGLLLYTGYGYWKGRQEYQKLQESYTFDKAGSINILRDREGQSTEKRPNQTEGSRVKSTDLPNDAPEQTIIDWEGLIEENRDVVAWLEMPAADISYPVLQGDDNEYYLHRGIHGEYLFAGSLFVDYRNSAAFQNLNTVVYGHNMNDGSMFARILRYGDRAVWESCPYFWIYTPEGDFLYRIGSVHTAQEGGDSYTIRFSDEKAYGEWLQHMLACSQIDTDVSWTVSDRVVTLSTCTGQDGQRWLVQGSCVWKG